jgi:hypothetical protein
MHRSFANACMMARLSMQVTAYSVQEDWIMGETIMVHRYSSPTVSYIRMIVCGVH